MKRNLTEAQVEQAVDMRETRHWPTLRIARHFAVTVSLHQLSAAGERR
jgi:hypothetical protein